MPFVSQLTISQSALRQWLDEAPRERRRVPLYATRAGTQLVWLAHGLGPHSTRPAATLDVRLCRSEDDLRRLSAQVADSHPADDAQALLLLGLDQAAGHGLAWAADRRDGWQPVPRLRIVGAGLPRLDALDRGSTAADRVSSAGDETQFARALRSRTIGALGDDTWLRLRRLMIVIAGLGRTGSLLSTSLARLGLGHSMIDADSIELHNLGEMDGVGQSDLRARKVAGLQAHHARSGLATSRPMTAIDESITSFAAWAECKQADLLFCCVDNPAARIAATLLSGLYLVPLVDLGTGVLRPPSANDPPAREMGADVRLVLPGRCLLCLGGVRGAAEGAQRLLDEAAGRPLGVRPPWNQERAGSLRSLNLLAVGLGLRLFEDLVEGRIADSLWLRLDYAVDGTPALAATQPAAERDCPICRYTGTGDEGLAAAPQILEQVIGRPSR